MYCLCQSHISAADVGHCGQSEEEEEECDRESLLHADTEHPKEEELGLKKGDTAFILSTHTHTHRSSMLCVFEAVNFIYTLRLNSHHKTHCSLILCFDQICLC